jgi:hypothetical protein
MVYAFDIEDPPLDLQQKVEQLNAQCRNWTDAECQRMFFCAYDAMERKMEKLLGIGPKSTLSARRVRTM